MNAEIANHTPEDLGIKDTGYVKGQAIFIREQLESLKIPGIEASEVAENRDVSSFSGKRVLALSSLADDNLSIAIGAGQSSTLSDCMVIVVAPTDDGSGILENKRTNRIYTDSFWVFENGGLHYIRPSLPLGIDSIQLMFEHDQRDSFSLIGQYELSSRLHNLTDNKQTTREVLQKAGVRIPRGLFLESWSPESERAINDFINDPAVKGFVVKELTGAHGEGVIMFERDEIVDAMRYMAETNLPSAILTFSGDLKFQGTVHLFYPIDFPPAESLSQLQSTAGSWQP